MTASAYASAAASAALPFGIAAPSRHPAAVRARVEALEHVLERAVAIPGLNRRIGLDSVIGFIPGIGDLVTGVLSAYLIWEARNLGLPRLVLLRMAANTALDTALGAVPIAGDIADVLFRSNTRNLRLLKRHLDRLHPASATIGARRA
jgi:hypothetical protein